MEEPSRVEKAGWELAREGIDLLLNNKPDEAETLFKNNTDSIQIAAGYAFLTFMNALMSYEEEKCNLALSTLRATERRCSSDAGWLKIVRSKVFGNESEPSLADSLEQQIILADSQVCIAILTFLQQDISSYIKGGWVLRKAWKIYQQVYNQLFELNLKYFGHDDFLANSCPSSPTENHENESESPTDGILWPSEVPHVSPDVPFEKHEIVESTATTSAQVTVPILNGYKNHLQLNKNSFHHHHHKPANIIPRSASGTSLKFSSLTHSLSYPFGFISDLINSSASEITSTKSEEITPKEVARLMSAVSFGYGVFQLSVSLLPPGMLKFTSLFGLNADRQVGLDNLMNARKGEDMRSPLATLALLSYHTIIRPYFALDGCNLTSGINISLNLMNEVRDRYGQSALFLFFEGRVSRLQANLPKALNCFQSAVDFSKQREIKLLCLHEVGWCYLIQLDYAQANGTFNALKLRSRWSRSFYSYLAVICAGASGILIDMDPIVELRNILTNSQKGVQINEYLMRRVKHFPNNTTNLADCNVYHWRMYTYELLYLWNALSNCSLDNLMNIIDECENQKEFEPIIGIANLVASSCYTILGKYDSSIECLRKCLAQRDFAKTNEHSHISAFAKYELAILLLKVSANQNESQELLASIQVDYKDYDFEHRLNVRVHSTLRIIRK